MLHGDWFDFNVPDSTLLVLGRFDFNVPDSTLLVPGRPRHRVEVFMARLRRQAWVGSCTLKPHQVLAWPLAIFSANAPEIKFLVTNLLHCRG